MSIILVHVPVQRLIHWKFETDTWSYVQGVPIFLVVFIVAVIHNIITKEFIVLTQKLKNKISEYCIEKM